MIFSFNNYILYIIKHNNFLEWGFGIGPNPQFPNPQLFMIILDNY